MDNPMDLKSKLKKILRLSLSLAVVDFKLRNERSSIGLVWYLLEPILSFIILLCLGRMLSPHKIPYYPAYLFCGLIIFNFFGLATSVSTSAIPARAGFIKSMIIPKEPFIISILIYFIPSHLFETIILISLALYSHALVSLQGLCIYFFIFLFFFIFTLGCCFILATIGVYIRDLPKIWGIVTRLWWVATPLFYSVDKTSALYTFNLFNPLYYFITALRGAMLNGLAPSLPAMIGIVLISVLTFLMGLYIFEINNNKFAEII
jgi:ABC-type polysaccharide/polyol phosphate export permease